VRTHACASIAASLWLGLAAAITYTFVSAFSLLSLGLDVVVGVALVAWLALYRAELAKKYDAAEATAAIPGRYDRQIWRVKPRIRDMAPGMALLGLGGYYFAYAAARGASPDDAVVGFIHQYFGVTGAVFFWSAVGTCLLRVGIETILGSRAAASE
jgi:hypothetical protein